MSTWTGAGASAGVAEAAATTPHTHAHTRTTSAPPTDRGHEITEPPRQPFQVHWFTGTAYLSAEDTFAHVHEVSGASLLAKPYGRNGYRSAYEAVELPGLMVLCDPGEPDTMPPVCIVVPGDSCESLGWQGLQALSAPFKPTRVDLAFDDFPFTPQEVKTLVLSDSVRTRAQRHTLKWHEDYSKGLGETVSLGGRGSAQFFRCYNSRGFNRGEFELKGELAVAAYELLQSPPDLAREMALSFVRRFIDFVEPSTSTNKTRQTLLPAWAAWIEHVQKAVIDLSPRPVSTLKTLWEWSKRQLAPVLAVLNTSDPSAFDFLLQHGQTRWTDRHRLLLGGA